MSFRSVSRRRHFAHYGPVSCFERKTADVAAQDVRDKVSSFFRGFPRETEYAPSSAKFDLDAHGHFAQHQRSARLCARSLHRR